MSSTPLERAATKGDLAGVRELLESHRASAHSAMVSAAIYERLPVVRYLLQHGVDPNGRLTYGRTAMFYAVNSGLPMIELLLEFGADLSVRDSSGQDALNAYLVSNGPGTQLGKADVAVERRLLAAGLEVRNDGENAHLLHAIATANVAIVELLLERGADPNGQQILWAAHICSKPEEMLAALANKPALDANKREVNAAMDSTILTEVCSHGDLKSAKALLDRGADPNAKGRSSPLAAAMESGNQVLVDLLLERGARPLHAPLGAEAAKALDAADRAANEKPNDPKVRLARARTLHEQGFRAAAAFEAQALQKLGVNVPGELSSFGKWTFVEFPPCEGAAPRTIDERFPHAWVTDGTRRVPLLLTMSAECDKCDDKGQEVCSKCDGKGSYSSYLDPDHDVDCNPRQRCYWCKGLKFQVTAKRFSKGSCKHRSVVDEGEVGDYGFKRCDSCGLAALSGELVTHYGHGVEFACGICSRFICTCEFSR